MSNETVHKLRTEMLIEQEKLKASQLSTKLNLLIQDMNRIAKHTNCHFSAAVARDAIESNK